MLAMSVNDVPDWSVTMEPRAIGVPVALTPGLVPHSEVVTAVEVGLGLLVLLELGELLPQPASAAIPRAAITTTPMRICDARRYTPTCLPPPAGDGKTLPDLGKVSRC